jgi:hypothetical protein
VILMKLNGVCRITIVSDQIISTGIPRAKFGSSAASALSLWGFQAFSCPPNPPPPA